MRSMRWSVLALSAGAIACSPMMMEPTLEVSVSPKTLRNDGQAATITVTATDEQGKAGTGNLRIKSAAGSLSGDGTTVMLSGGKAESEFTCPATDMGCRATVRITVEWTTPAMKLVQGGTSVTIIAVMPDAGTDAGVDAGIDAGVDAGIDAGFDAGIDAGDDGGLDAGMPIGPGTFDGGFYDQYRLTVVSIEKPTLLTGVLDELDVTFKLTTNTSGMLPVAMRMATVTVDRGASLDLMSPTPSVTRMTDANGQFTVTVFSGNATRGILNVVATALDAQVTAQVRAVSVALIEEVNDSTVIRTLAVNSNGMGNTTPVFFRLLDAMSMPVEGVDVDFSVTPNSAAGCTVLPARDRSNATGIVRTTLSAGDSSGTARVSARVVGLPERVSSDFNIVIGRPSDERLQLACNRSSLGALQSNTPPRTDQSADCTVVLADRNGRNVPFPLNVSWLTEAGNLPVSTLSMPGGQGVTATFRTGGNLPVLTTPLPAVPVPFNLPAEPSNGSANPRDAFVTIIAAVQGEEQFWDGSGSSNNISNGTWDPGEYWVDVPEPFADSNDNGIWDPGEPYIDTDRVNCATGQVEAKNSRWDPPNGCWDRSTQIWRATHVVYTGFPAGGAPGAFLRFQPAIPLSMLPDTLAQIQVSWTDSNFNRFSSDNATIQVVTISGTRGTATIGSTSIGGESFGHGVDYKTVRAQVSDAGAVLAEEGDCDFQDPDSGYPAVRCLRRYKFTAWRTVPPSVTMNLVAPTPQSALSDGGVPPPTFTTFELRAANSLQSNPVSHQFTIQFP